MRKRLCVLGLDGLPFSLARRLAGAVPLPNLARLVDSPLAGGIRAELPELSPVNWTSFATAEGPERHGVFGFTRVDAAHYRLALADSAQVPVPTVFQRLAEGGLVSRVLNLPHAYPARPLTGPGATGSALVAGFIAPDLSRAVWPSELAVALAARGYRIEADTERGRTDHALLLDELRATLRGRLAALDLLWAGPDWGHGWDCFVWVLTETDRLLHFMYPAVAEADHPKAPVVAAFLKDWDAALGVFLDRYAALPEPKRLIALADHGFGPLDQEVDVNAWLRAEGFLRAPLAFAPLDLSPLTPESRAFALDPGRVYLHRSDRFARGGVPESRALAQAASIKAGLEALTWQGRRVMERVWTAKELYPGPMAAVAPDLVCEPASGFSLTAKFDRQAVFTAPEVHGRHGTHRSGDAFHYDSEGARPRTVRDVGRHILEYFHLT